MIRATQEEKQEQLKTLHNLWERNKENAVKDLKSLQDAATHNENTFEQLMEVAKSCSLGQITQALFEVGGQYRRNM